MRIAVVDDKRCNPKKCNLECMRFCPKNRAGVETVRVGRKARIDEGTCIGCGICVHKCPFKAITVVNLPEETGSPIHKYGENGFRVFKLPLMRKGVSIGVLGRNGMGKSTILSILSGELRPNLGKKEASEREVIKYFAGTENQAFFEGLYEGRIRTAKKPQHVDKLPKLYDEVVGKLLKKVDERGVMDELVTELGLKVNRKLSELSGGELQKVAIAATLGKEADLYLFDEPSSYLDVKQRLEVGRVIRKYTQGKMLVVVEHDLILLDYLTDLVHVVYGKPGAYGIVSLPLSTREGINAFILGELKRENVRFRDYPLEFLKSRRDRILKGEELFRWGELKKRLGDFELRVRKGEIKVGELIGCAGPNGIGKTTFAKLLAGVLKPDEGELELDLKVAYKPQYLKADERRVKEVVRSKKLLSELDIGFLSDSRLTELSGGELQRVAIASTLEREADLYLFDEPSAHLDVEERIKVAKSIKKRVEEKGRAAIIIDHDIMFLDYLSDRLFLFLGEPGRRGETKGPMDVREGMNEFLKGLGITFRRDEETGRPRANKPGSVKDREQKEAGKYYI